MHYTLFQPDIIDVEEPAGAAAVYTDTQGETLLAVAAREVKSISHDVQASAQYRPHCR